jgi:hypothetical protein
MRGLRGLQGPEEAEAGAEGSHGQLADIVAGELEGAPAAARLGILGKGMKR